MCTGYAKEIQAWVCEQERQRSEGFLSDWGDELLAIGGASASAMDEAGRQPVLPQSMALDGKSGTWIEAGVAR